MASAWEAEAISLFGDGGLKSVADLYYYKSCDC